MKISFTDISMWKTKNLELQIDKNIKISTLTYF